MDRPPKGRPKGHRKQTGAFLFFGLVYPEAGSLKPEDGPPLSIRFDSRSKENSCPFLTVGDLWAKSVLAKSSLDHSSALS